MRQRLEYLNQYTGKSTPISHKSSIKAFLNVSLKVQIGRSENQKPYAEKYLNEKRSIEDMEDDVKSFFSTIKGAPPKTIILMLSIVRIFFQEKSR